jgi:signal transduction histidine kinase
MSASNLRRELEQARGTIRLMQDELEETNRGLVALTVELEKRVEARTAELRLTQEELEKTNSELLHLTLELEDRVAERTAQLQSKNEEVKTMSQQLWQAAKLATMGELAASIAHELNNPLATVSLRIESLLELCSPVDPQHHTLLIIQQEVERMASLIANLLQFSRRGTSRVSTLNLADEIEKTLELIQYQLRNHNIQVVQELASNDLIMNADRQKVRQLFLNLFTNASDAMPQGGTLTIRGMITQAAPSSAAADPRTDALPMVVIEIADTGIGIAAENLPRLGEAFFTTKPVGKGTGLGLAICHRIVQEHKGSLDILSEVNHGTTIRVVLPVRSEAGGGFLDES